MKADSLALRNIEEYLRGNPLIASPQDILGRLAGIGELLGQSRTGAEDTLLAPFLDNDTARKAFSTAATS